MLKVIVLMLLINSYASYAQNLTPQQCQGVKDLVDFKLSQTNFTIITQGISQKEIDQHRAKGILISKIASEAAVQGSQTKDYVPVFYQKHCQNQFLDATLLK